MREEILSVGIDIGTSTTSLVFSRLVIENRASSFSVPRISIVEKIVSYKSEIYDTPLLSPERIDARAVKEIVSREYEKAGKSPSEVSTGAVIITGETARKENAGAVLEALSAMAGDFVVATAGPELESVLAARGAGADRLSEALCKTLANLDIGGGTTNIAVYKNGVLKGASCLDIGGRLVRTENGRISYIFPRLAKQMIKSGISLNVGDEASEEKLRALCAMMADTLSQALGCKSRDTNHEEFYTNGGSPLSAYTDIRALTFSGGVADFIYAPAQGDYFRFGDIGPLLGDEICRNRELSRLELLRPAETIRATVVGAGTHTTEVSGSTIVYDRELLPMKNLPVLRIEPDAEGAAAGLSQKLREGLALHTGGAAPAISLSGRGFTGFKQIQELAQELISGAASIIGSGQPLIILLERDIAKALGNALRVRLPKDAGLICIDGIAARAGDYADIGASVGGGAVLPVVIKTLIFNT